MTRSPHESSDESVRHLIELGYVDPAMVAAREVELRRARKHRLKQAIENYEDGREQEAVALLEVLLAEDADWITPHERLAEIHFWAGRLQDARAQLDWLTHHGVESPRLSFMAGAIALARREMRTALELLEYAQFVEPELPGVDSVLGTVYLRLGRWSCAEASFHRALEQKAEDVRALDGLAVVALRRGEFEAAADFALRALEGDMRFYRAHVHLGIALMGLGRAEQAIQALEAAARVAPERTAPYYWLRRVASGELNDGALAEAYRERARGIIRGRKSGRA